MFVQTSQVILEVFCFWAGKFSKLQPQNRLVVDAWTDYPTKYPTVGNIHRIPRKLFFTEYRFKEVFSFYQCTRAFGGTMVKDEKLLSEIYTSSEPKYSIREHVELLSSRKNFFKKRSDKSAISDVKRFEIFQRHSGEYLILTAKH